MILTSVSKLSMNLNFGDLLVICRIKWIMEIKVG